MKPSISIICQNDGVTTATQIAKLLADQDLPVVGNFPSVSGSLETHSAKTLVNEQTALVILVVSDGWLGQSRLPSARTIDPEAMQRLFSLSSGAQNSRIFPVLVDDSQKSNVENTWIAKLNWYVDSTKTRNILLKQAEHLETVGYFDDHLSAFDGVHSVIRAIEAASDVKLVAKQRVTEKNVAYDVYECSHKIHGTATVYIHLYRGVTLTNTALHLLENPVADPTDTIFLLSHETGQTQLADRIENVRKAFRSTKVRYLEDIVSQQIRTATDQALWDSHSNPNDYFLEPQLRRGLAVNQLGKGSDFNRLVDWLESDSAGVTVVEGQGGIGKTWIMKELLGRIRSGNISFIKEIERSTIFIASTDVNRPGSSLNDISGSFTLYDLYVAAVSGRQTQGQTATPIEEETFYNALKIGNLVVFVDGLDEVIARRRGSFDPDLFFGNLQEMMKGGSNAKVIISCRTIFFDQFEYVMKFPSVQTYELLAFDKALRDRYLQDSLGTLPNKVNRARQISEELAVLPDTKRYVPFVLSLIVEIMIEEADDPASSVEGGFKNYFSERLLQSEYSDRVIGQFCEREIKKVGDKFRCLTVDQQVDVFCGLARMNEGDNGRADSKVVTKLIREATGLRSVGDLTDTFLSHPFLVVTKIGADSIVSIRFDFMTEQFLMLGLSEVLLADPNDETEPSHTLTVLDVLIFNKYCSANSIMCRGLSLRLGSDSDVFGLNIIGFHFTGERLIEQELEDSESNILKPGSAASQFSYSLISLIVAQMSLKGDLSTEALTKMLIDIFSSSDKTISRMAIIDGVHTGDRRFRLDFRGLTFVECLFHSIDIWSCQFDEASNFQRCRFISCDGIRSRDSGITENTFDMNCVFDEVFERVFAKGQTRVVDAQEKVKTDILSFVSDFYSSGRFEDFTEDYIAKHYSRTNPTVPIKKMIQAFKRNGVLVRNPRKRDTYWHMVADDAKASIERLVTQGVLSGSLKKIAQDLC